MGWVGRVRPPSGGRPGQVAEDRYPAVPACLAAEVQASEGQQVRMSPGLPAAAQAHPVSGAQARPARA